eukprot:Gb_25940 [translate_table: standard]
MLWVLHSRTINTHHAPIQQATYAYMQAIETIENHHPAPILVENYPVPNIQELHGCELSVVDPSYPELNATLVFYDSLFPFQEDSESKEGECINTMGMNNELEEDVEEEQSCLQYPYDLEYDMENPFPSTMLLNDSPIPPHNMHSSLETSQDLSPLKGGEIYDLGMFQMDDPEELLHKPLMEISLDSGQEGEALECIKMPSYWPLNQIWKKKYVKLIPPPFRWSWIKEEKSMTLGRLKVAGP